MTPPPPQPTAALPPAGEGRPADSLSDMEDAAAAGDSDVDVPSQAPPAEEGGEDEDEDAGEEEDSRARPEGIGGPFGLHL